jgi:hypothetical protein
MRRIIGIIIISLSLFGCEVDFLCTKEIYKNGLMIERTQELSNEGFCDCQPSYELINGNSWRVLCY